MLAFLKFSDSIVIAAFDAEPEKFLEIVHCVQGKVCPMATLVSTYNEDRLKKM